MKENIHPKYEQTTITCACGNVTLKSAQSAILSTQESRSLLIQADVLTDSRSVSTLRNNIFRSSKAARLCRLIFV